MAEADGKVVIDTEISDADFKAALMKMAGEFDKFTKTMDKQASSVGDKISAGLVKGIKAVTAATIASTAAVFGWAKAATAVGDRVDKMSQKLGMSRKTFQELEYVAKQSGTNIEALGTSMKTLAVQAVNNSDAFRKLGISVKDSSGNYKDQEKLFFETVSALQKIEDTTKRTAVATQLLGKGAIELAPMLNSGAASMDELRKKANDLGIILSDKVVNASVAFGDTIDDLTASLKSVFVNAMAPLLPELQKLGEEMVKGTGAGGEFRAAIEGIAQILVKFVTEILPEIIRGLGYLKDGLFEIGRWLGEKIAQAIIFVTGKWKEFKIVGVQALLSIQYACVALTNYIVGNLTRAVQSILETFSKIPLIGDDFKGAVEATKSFADGLEESEKAIINEIAALEKERQVLAAVNDEKVKFMEGKPGEQTFSSFIKSNAPQSEQQPQGVKTTTETTADVKSDLKSITELWEASMKSMSEASDDAFSAAFQSILGGFEDVGKAIIEGEDAWGAFAAAGVNSAAAVLDALANILLAEAAGAIVKKDYSGAAVAFAGAAAAKVASGVLRATAGKFADGGIVGGSSYNGDRVLARVNSGELILNEAQQGNIARALSSMQAIIDKGGTGGGNLQINVINNAGAEIGINESSDGDERILEIFVEKVIGDYMASPSKGGKLMGGVYGLNQVGRRAV